MSNAMGDLAIVAACGKKQTEFDVAGKIVSLNQKYKFLDVSFQTSDAFEYTNTGHQELLYELKDESGTGLFYFYIKYGLMNFGNRASLEEDMESETKASGISELNQEEKKIGKKTWTVISYKTYSEEFGKEIVCHIYYAEHTHISETGFYKLTFRNTEEAPDLEDAIVKSVTFN